MGITKQYEIKDINSVFKTSLLAEETIENYTAKPFLDPGENFGSVVLGVTVTIKNNKTNNIRTLKVIAKMIPKSEQLRELFSVQVTVKREINMYTTVIQELKRFSREYNFPEELDFLCEYYGSRLSLDETSTTVDEHAILVLENLKESGYEMVDRLKGFDLETANIVLNDLALFHAIPIAFKLKKPKEFTQVFLPLLETDSALKKPDTDLGENLRRMAIYHAIEANPECAKYESKLLDKLNNSRLSNTTDAINDPFCTICHVDLWTNNIMIKYINGVPMKSKLIDFQMYFCASLAKDLFFFLFSSVQMPILEKHYDELIEHYRKRFIQVLDFFGCSTDIYTLERFHTEIKKSSESEIGHVLFMHRVIMAERGSITDQDDNNNPGGMFKAAISDKYKKRLADVILTFAKKGWL